MGLVTAAEVDPKVVCEAAGLEATDEERAETGREGGTDGAGKALEKLGAVLGLSFIHVGASLEEASLLVLLGSRPGVACWMFAGKSLRGGHLSTGASDLTSQSELVLDRFEFR